jgi:hypothetical protein
VLSVAIVSSRDLCGMAVRLEDTADSTVLQAITGVHVRSGSLEEVSRESQVSRDGAIQVDADAKHSIGSSTLMYNIVIIPSSDRQSYNNSNKQITNPFYVFSPSNFIS